MAFEYFVHAYGDPNGDTTLPGVPLSRPFFNPTHALAYAEALAVAYPDGYITIQVEYLHG